ncbi:tetratricopeptide repeat protein [Legionella oakridgensis]|uniref:Sel1 repeat protein n=2 Tax=Legionella oakridgensis TaxID=29423 RepID=W0BA79_9GAMM|nr:tetratricopeptide repeat protein [Legionella oakridgensis]AHE67438.1 Sel1 repeat protein [Legionella oakridgensis ATCC 33761 = DSM 21215]ETO92969.1 hypothetical protein LOR_44c06960 [Legionella oakridgensis RV-2-2007]KTD43497.1 Sel-1 protein [Legionella oakridgensis]STY20489.1 Sel-1 protein [Legionella longbeachae]
MFFKCRIFVFIGVLCLLNGCSISHLNFQEGIKSFQIQDYRQAFIRLKPEAEKGQPDAQYAVGYMYYYGQGVVEDRKKALYWIKCAANAGQPDAIAALKILGHSK